MIEFIYTVSFILLCRMSNDYGDWMLNYLKFEKAKWLLLIDLKKEKLKSDYKIAAKELKPGVWQISAVPHARNYEV